MADIAFEKDLSVAGCPRHYIMRSSWVIDEGHNFVKTMNGLSDRVADPEDGLEQVTVVDDQLGRLTFTRDMAEAVFHVLDTRAPLRHLRLHRLRRREVLGGHRPRRLRGRQRQRREGRAGVDRRLLRERRGSHHAAPGPLRVRPVQA